MSDNPPTVSIQGVDGSALPPCSRCGRRVTMVVNLGPYGHGTVELCLTCDQDRPARAAWLNYLASGKAADASWMTEEDMEELKRLWLACLADVLSASPLGLPMQPPASGKNPH